jgi:hypothetical protein
MVTTIVGWGRGSAPFRFGKGLDDHRDIRTSIEGAVWVMHERQQSREVRVAIM